VAFETAHSTDRCAFAARASNETPAVASALS
jgi:hypothetical protein